MADVVNTIVEVKPGEIGFLFVLEFVETGGRRMNFTPTIDGDYTIIAKISKQGSKTTLRQWTLNPLIPQTGIDEGAAGHVMDADDFNVIRRPADYDIEGVVTEPTGEVHKFPKEKEGKFCTLRLLSTKS